jgi:PPOX class probable F420-dependent enzyme
MLSGFSQEALRVLGCLIEKEHTTPDYYPMTVNGLTAACNQKTNREPVTDLSEDAITKALDELRSRELVTTTRVSGGRTVKYKHKADTQLELSTPEASALAVLLLRGDQTVGEVRTRTDRYVEFANLEEVRVTLESLANAGLVAELDRQPGEKENRWRHQLATTPKTASIASNRIVGRAEMVDFVRTRHRAILVTERADGRPQLSPVTMGVDDSGRLVISTYPHRAKALNIRRRSEVSVCVLSDDFGGEWIQVDGRAEVLDLPGALEPLVEYFRNISGEHEDWDEYRRAMQNQGKVLIRIDVDRWGPVSKGGFPAHLFEAD